MKNGLDIDDLISELYQHDYTIIESIRFLVSEYNMGLQEAKTQVANHPLWRDVVEAAQPLHEELIAVLKNYE